MDLNELTIAYIIKSILQALYYLHQNSVIHMNISIEAI